MKPCKALITSDALYLELPRPKTTSWTRHVLPARYPASSAAPGETSEYPKPAHRSEMDGKVKGIQDGTRYCAGLSVLVNVWCVVRPFGPPTGVSLLAMRSSCFPMWIISCSEPIIAVKLGRLYSCTYVGGKATLFTARARYVMHVIPTGVRAPPATSAGRERACSPSHCSGSSLAHSQSRPRAAG